jgi:hypothetical protein
MFAVYVAVTVLTALATLFAASLSFAGHESVRLAAQRVRAPEAWMARLGVVLLSGGIGLFVGLAVPALGTTAAAGLVLYFICAIGAHVKARDRHVGAAGFFLALAVATLALHVAYGSTV